MKVETIEIAGLAAALTALRLPFGKEVRSNIFVDININIENWFSAIESSPQIITCSNIHAHPKDITLMQTLIKRGDEHAKVMRGIIAWAKIEEFNYGHEQQ